MMKEKEGILVMDILELRCIAECVAVKKKTSTKMFSKVKVGDEVVFSVPVKAVGGNRGNTYAVGTRCVSKRIVEVKGLTFNEIGRVLDCFEFVQK